ncbi:ribosome assembly cofactor RimP [Flavobacterium sp.]|uniref:ribosome assembly cofactor RimP n=1 Tax=Flavobacterium sp. TaxID=239 RepID=UPI003529D0EE
MSFKERVQELLKQALNENPSLFLIDFTINTENKIKVILDGDSGVSLQDCVNVSRVVEHNLDRETQDFALEVMSAGASSPLVNIRQYKKNIGRKLKVKTIEGSVLEGQLTQANEDGFTLEWKAREPKQIGKGKETVEKKEALLYNQVKEATVIISF